MHKFTTLSEFFGPL